MSFELPSNDPVTNEEFGATLTWLAWFDRIHRICQNVERSGTSAQRPTSGLYYGLEYYDRTLNKPVYFNALPSVWRDAMGNIV